MEIAGASEFVQDLRDAAHRCQFTSGRSSDDRKDKTTAHQLVQPVVTIALEVAPNEAEIIRQMAIKEVWGLVEASCDRLLGLLENAGRLQEILGPKGPQLAASGLHPSVWGAAARLWDGGHRREAVQAAAVVVEVAIQAKTGRDDLSGAKLIGEVFSLEPPRPRSPRLRFSAYRPDTPDWRSAHEGAQALARACATGIRNLVTHRLEQPHEQAALEYLAILSVLARWTDEMDLVAAS